MKALKSLKPLVYIFFSILLLSSCENPIDEVANEQSIIFVQVENQDGSRVSEATVLLYNNLQDYEERRNPIYEGTSDQYGEHVIKDMPIDTYFLHVEKDDQTSWGGNYFDHIELFGGDFIDMYVVIY